MISTEIKEKLNSDGIVLGTFVKSSSPTIVEVLGLSGLDFIIVDTEHAPCDQAQLENIIRAANCVNLPVIVRVPVAKENFILKSLDLGAAGVQLPGLETTDDVYEAIQFTKYAPKGVRGLSFSQRSAQYGIVDKKEYMHHSNEYLINVVHIENKFMVDNIEELCMLGDVDVLFIGPMDLSQSLGYPGDVSHYLVRETILDIIRVCKKYNRACGIFVNSIEEVNKYKELGVKYFALGSDIGFLFKGIKNTISQVK